MNRLRQEIDALALDLAWSQWAELGVDGAVRRHDWQAIDLEPLIIFTAHLGGADNRLRASAIDWRASLARESTPALRRDRLSEAPLTRAVSARSPRMVESHR
jgi:hypothetical protein